MYIFVFSEYVFYIFRCSSSREVSDLFHSFARRIRCAKSSALINWNSELCIYVCYTVQISYFNTTLRLGCVLCIEDKKNVRSKGFCSIQTLLYEPRVKIL
jgi:hypothetical protein